MYTARIKPYWEGVTRHNRRSAPGVYRVLCGYVNCLGELGRYHVRGGNLQVWLAPGYVEVKPGTWQLGHHARRRWDHSTRRPRLSKLPSSQQARRARDGMLILPDGRPEYPAIRIFRRQPGPLRATNPHEGAYFEVPVLVGVRLTISCPRCGLPCAFTAEDPRVLAEAIGKEVV